MSRATPTTPRCPAAGAEEGNRHSGLLLGLDDLALLNLRVARRQQRGREGSSASCHHLYGDLAFPTALRLGPHYKDTPAGGSVAAGAAAAVPNAWPAPVAYVSV